MFFSNHINVCETEMKKIYSSKQIYKNCVMLWSWSHIIKPKRLLEAASILLTFLLTIVYLPTEPHRILPTRSVQRTIERFHMTSRRPYRCSETIKRRPCWCSKPILWELICFLMSLSFVPINLHRYYSREWKRSIGNRLLARWRHLLLRPESFSFFFSCENFIPARFKWKIRNLHKKGKPWWTLVVVVNDVILQMAHSN